MNFSRPSSVIPKKHLGQHFLTDPNIKSRIIEACNLKPDDVILEIGSGLGILTREIVSRVAHVYAVEKDPQLCQELQNSQTPNLTIIHNDILKYDLTALPANTKVIGNLPYYISSPIIEKFLTHHPRFTDLFFTVQLEFGQRLNAKLNTKDYSALTGFAQYYADTKMLFKIGKSAFSPAPKVFSCFMHLKPREPITKAQDSDLLFKIIHLAFQQRRKKILNALTSLWDKETVKTVLKQTEINQELRPENIALNNYVNLANVAYGLNQEEKEKGRSEG